MRMAVIAVVFLAIMAMMNIYSYRRFLRRLGPRLGRYLILIPIVLMLGELLFALESLTHFMLESSRLFYILSASVGATFLLFVVALVYDLVMTVSSKVPLDQERRQFIKVVFDVTMLIAAS